MAGPVARDSGASAEARGADLAVEVSRLAEQLRAMEQEARKAREALARRLDVAEQRGGAAPSASDAAADAGGELPEAEVSAESIVFTLDDAFAEETRDAGWAMDTEELLYRQLSSPELGVAASAVIECRTTLCTIEGLHTDADAQARFIEAFPMLLDGMSGYVQAEVSADGSPMTRVYVARVGFGLPAMP
jgi:hypothetical protein